MHKVCCNLVYQSANFEPNHFVFGHIDVIYASEPLHCFNWEKVRFVWFWRGSPHTWVCYWVRGRPLGLCVWVDISLPPPSQFSNCTSMQPTLQCKLYKEERVGALGLPVLNCQAAHATNCFPTGERRDIFTTIFINIILFRNLQESGPPRLQHPWAWPYIWKAVYSPIIVQRMSTTGWFF